MNFSSFDYGQKFPSHSEFNLNTPLEELDPLFPDNEILVNSHENYYGFQENTDYYSINNYTYLEEEKRNNTYLDYLIREIALFSLCPASELESNIKKCGNVKKFTLEYGSNQTKVGEIRRILKAVKSGHPTFSDEKLDNIVYLYEVEHQPYTEIGKKYNISKTTANELYQTAKIRNLYRQYTLNKN